MASDIDVSTIRDAKTLLQRTGMTPQEALVFIDAEIEKIFWGFKEKKETKNEENERTTGQKHKCI